MSYRQRRALAATQARFGREALSLITARALTVTC